MCFFNGLRNIALGVGQVLVGIGKAAFAFLKFMLFAAVCVIVGIYSAAQGVFDFAKKAYRKLKKERPNVTIEGTGTSGVKALSKIIKDTKKEVAENAIKLSDLEKEEVLDDLNKIQEKINNGEANGMRWVEGKNEQGEDEILDAELIHYEQLSADDKRRDDTETVFIQKIA